MNYSRSRKTKFVKVSALNMGELNSLLFVVLKSLLFVEECSFKLHFKCFYELLLQKSINV